MMPRAIPMLRLTLLTLVLLGCTAAIHAAEVIPPAPTRHFTDTAGVVSGAVAGQLDARLAAFERETSNQFLVVIYPRMPSDSSVEDYTVRVAQKWGAGQKGRDNGVILFVFTGDRQLYIQVGYGLEGALPDILCKRIIDSEIVPRLKQGDFDGGLRAGVEAIIQATRGEYKGTGKTVNGGRQQIPQTVAVVAFILLFLLMTFLKGRSLGTSYGGHSGWGSGRGFGGGFGGGGGGFSGGGGSFGGGGAGGRW